MKINSPLFQIVGFLALLLTVSCRNEGSSRLNENMDELVSDKYDEWNNRDSTETRANPIKSGIIYMQSTKPIHGSDVERTIYFDDYGHKKYSETVTIINVGDQRVTTTQVTIDADGYTYKYDPDKKLGTRAKTNRSFNPTQIDFTKLDKLTMENFGIQREGTETVVGKECVVYTINYPAMNFKGRYAVWNNLPLREESGTTDFNYEYVATKLVENATIPESRFEIPSDIDIQEASMAIPDRGSELTQPAVQ